MNNLIFQTSRRTERIGAIQHLLQQADPSATVIIFSPHVEDIASTTSMQAGNSQTTTSFILGCCRGAESFNPLDALRFMIPMGLEERISTLVKPIMPNSSIDRFLVGPIGAGGEPAWRVLAIELAEALIRHHVNKNGSNASLVMSTAHFFDDDVVYKLAVLLDSEGKLIEPNIYAVVAAFLQASDEQRSIILSIIQGMFSFLNTNPIQEALGRTTFDLDSLSSGGTTVYVETRPQWAQHVRMIQLWLSAFIQISVASCGRGIPMVFVLDDASSLDVLPQLWTSRQLPVEIWSFWEGLSQVSAERSAEWAAFVGSCRTVQALGPQSHMLVGELSSAFAISPTELIGLSPGRSLILSSEISGTVEADPCSGALTAMERGHILTFAPLHTNKWRGLAAAILARVESSLVVIESAGQCYALTAATRSETGRVIRLDPFWSFRRGW